MCPVDSDPEVIVGSTAELGIYADSDPPLSESEREIRWHSPRGEAIVPSQEGRVVLNETSKELTVHNVSLEDSGTYTIDIHSEGEVLATATAELNVHGEYIVGCPCLLEIRLQWNP